MCNPSKRKKKCKSPVRPQVQGLSVSILYDARIYLKLDFEMLK